jgi:hypothetical protein
MADDNQRGGPDRAEVPDGGPPPAPQSPRPSADLTGGAGWRVATQVVGLAGAAVLLGLSVWLGHAAIRSGASLPAALAMFLGAFVLLGAALTAAIIGVLGWPARAPGRADPLEVKAGDLGLPTDPAAYQDGGLATAATARTVPEADLIAGCLKASGVPAWVDQPNAMTTLWYVGLRPEGVRVLVPLGRLADAKQVLAEHRPAPAPEEGEDARRPRRLVHFFAILIVSCVLASIVTEVAFIFISAFVGIPETAMWAVGIPAILVITTALMVIFHRHRGARP